MKKILSALVLLFSSSMSHAAGLDLALSNESANLAVLFNPPGTVSNSEMSVGALFNDYKDLVMYASIMATGPGQYNDDYYTLGAGIKIYAGSLDNEQSIGALAIGGRFGVYLFTHPVNPVDFVFEGFYAPGITSTGDTESLMEISARLRVEIVRSARAYLGYRLMKADTDEFDNVEIDDNVHIGISIDFY